MWAEACAFDSTPHMSKPAFARILFAIVLSFTIFFPSKFICFAIFLSTFLYAVVIESFSFFLYCFFCSLYRYVVLSRNNSVLPHFFYITSSIFSINNSLTSYWWNRYIFVQIIKFDSFHIFNEFRVECSRILEFLYFLFLSIFHCRVLNTIAE